MNKTKKICLAAASVFLCLCIIIASVIFVKKDKKNTTVQGFAKASGTSGTDLNGISTEAESTASSETETLSATETETSSQTQTTVKNETTTAKPTTTVTSVLPTETTTLSPISSNTGDSVSHSIEGSLPQKAAVPGSWFDDAVFVGDSISLKLSYYEASADRLGKAQFLVAGSLSATNALWDVSDKSVHPRYNGQKQKIEDSIAQMNVKKVYIMLGMNDINVAGIDGSVRNFETLCNRILAKSPDVQIFVQAVTPMAASSNIASSKEGRLNNKSIFEYNKKLAALSAKRGWYFVNVASVMFDGNGYLKNEYCGDLSSMGIHFTDAGCRAWVDYLLTHTP